MAGISSQQQTPLAPSLGYDGVKRVNRCALEDCILRVIQREINRQMLSGCAMLQASSPGISMISHRLRLPPT